MTESRFRVRLARLPAFLLALACAAPVHAFDSGSTGADGALNPAVNVQIQLPPSGVLNYTSVNIPTGVTVTFKRNALNTPVYLLASGNVTIAGTISVTGGNGRDTGSTGDGNLADDGIPGVGGPGGFDGGRGGNIDSDQRASIVEGGAGNGPGGGQGGRVVSRIYQGAQYYYSCNDNRASGYEWYGLGAGYASSGPDAAYAAYGCNGGSPAALVYGSARLQPLVGGSGGGGARSNNTVAGSGGGGGGGAILIAATGTLSVVGQILADGGNSGRYGAYPGGGGSGGAIRLVASTIAGNGTVYARRGCALNYYGNQECSDPYSASPGRIRVEADSLTFSGTSDPLFSAAAPSSIALSNVPAVRITSVAGVNVPAQPTGVADMSFPTTVANPVTVVFSTINVPAGSTINLRVLPSSGLPVDAVSTAITGDLSSGSASATVVLPQGPSRLEARTSFAVTAQQSALLSSRASGELVKSVEVVSESGAEPKAILVTVSGKRFEVPIDVLRAEGLWS